MKKYLVEYENCCIMFGDKKDSRVVEAESEKSAIGTVVYESNYVLKNLTAKEI